MRYSSSCVNFGASVVLAIVIAMSPGCGAERKYETAKGGPATERGNGEPEVPSQETDLAGVMGRLRNLAVKCDPRVEPTAAFPLKDITTDDVRSRTGGRLFLVTGGPWGGETVLALPKRLHLLCTRVWFGWGPRDLCVTDLNGDGNPELVYQCSLGSGRDIRQIVVLEPTGSRSGRASFPPEDATSTGLVLERISDKRVDLFHTRRWDPNGLEMRRVRIGSIRQRPSSAVPELVLERPDRKGSGSPSGVEPTVVPAHRHRDDT